MIPWYYCFAGVVWRSIHGLVLCCQDRLDAVIGQLVIRNRFADAMQADCGDAMRGCLLGSVAMPDGVGSFPRGFGLPVSGARPMENPTNRSCLRYTP